MPLDRLITALGIHGVGEVLSSDLARYYGSLDGLMHASPEELMDIDGVGPNIAQSIVDWFRQPGNKALLQKFRSLGIWPLASKSDQFQAKGAPLGGITFVITGSFGDFSRDELTALIQLNGGKVTNSVSKNTNYLLVGENPGSKFEKARELGVTIIDEHEFRRLLDVKDKTS